MSDSTILPAFAVLGIGFASFVVWFNRDPERHPPSSRRVVVSPADGRVIYLRVFGKSDHPVSRKFGKDIHLGEVDDGAVFPSGGYLVGIRLSPLDVHVNRSPIAGVVRIIRHTPGRLVSINPPRLLEESERNTLIIENDAISVGVVQMAAYLVRRTVVNVREGAEVALGQKIGSIRLGSQVDLMLPNSSLTLCVRPGQRLRAGETIVARFGV